jgi:hypothetical protein
LLGAVRPDQPSPDAPSALLRPTVLGLSAAITPKASGTLYLKLNDSPASRADNSGKATLRIAP